MNNFLSVGGGFLFISLALLIVMALAGVWRRRWWLPAAPALVAVSLLFAFVQPYLIPDLDPLRDPRVAADARQLAAEEGISGTTVRVQNTHNLGGGPNAEAAGIGPSKRVILWDTLLERFRRAEIRVVLAHEFAHLSRNHILKTFAWMALLALPIAFLVALTTRRRGGLFEPAAVPIAIFVVVALLFVLSPLQRAFSQRLEAEADWVALEATRDPGAAKALFRRFTRVALVQPDPPGWAGLLIDTHPSMHGTNRDGRGVAGSPAATAAECASEASAPDRIRTCDFRLRRHGALSTELRAPRAQSSPAAGAARRTMRVGRHCAVGGEAALHAAPARRPGGADTVGAWTSSVVFLGTGGSVPTARRATACLLARAGGERLLFDCGEGSQRQMQRSTGPGAGGRDLRHPLPRRPLPRAAGAAEDL